jgi:ABC-type multidrug transport system fused ATPase/permease subunit
MYSRIKSFITSSIIYQALRILPRSDRPKILAITMLQVGLGFLDLLGVAAMGVLGALAVTGVQSQQPGNRVSQVLEMLGISNLTFQSQVAFLGICAAGILIIRTIISVYVTRKVLFFLSHRGAFISASLVSRLLTQPLTKVQEKTVQEISYGLTAGVSSITLGVLGAAIAVLADSSLLFIMLFGLVIVDPLTAITTVLFFGSLGFVLYKIMNVRAHKLGYLNSEYSVAGNEKIIEVLESYRESVVRNRRSFYSNQIGLIRRKHSDVLAEMQFMPNVSKYVIESGMVVGAVFIAGVQFAFQDARHAVAALSVFLAAGTRIAPAIMRLQQSLVQIRNSMGSAMPTLDLIKSLANVPELDNSEDALDLTHKNFVPEIQIKNVSLKYPSKNTYALKNITLTVAAGESIAIVGPSGSGKTSLVDVILGVLKPESGVIFISGKNSNDAITTWPGAIAYVPQDVRISNGTFRENIALGYPLEVAKDSLIWEALDTSQLTEFVKELPQEIDTQVGERGTKISGGQRQRLGIARAMFTKPKLLVLDEATSSLDGQTESNISEAINKLKGSVTVIVVAHRLSTIRDCDKVIYLSSGEILCQGTFEQVRDSVPDFDNQAQLMGL